MADSQLPILVPDLSPDDERILTLAREADAAPEAIPALRGYVDHRWPEPALAPTAPAAAVAEAPAVDAPSDRRDFLLMLLAALGAAIAIKLPAYLGFVLFTTDSSMEPYIMNLGFFVFPFVAAYFLVKSRPRPAVIAVIAAAFAAMWVAVNYYPFELMGHTQLLTAVHTLIVLWLLTGLAYVGDEWRSTEKRMAYVRLSGETFVNWILLCLGGAVLAALTYGVFYAFGVDAGFFVTGWLLPCGGAAAVVVAAWLADTRTGKLSGLAPMLARAFTPLFATLLVALLFAVVRTRGVMDIERSSLIVLDLLLVVVLALILYSLSSRRDGQEPGWFDRMQLVLVGSTIIVDLVALANILDRVLSYGSTPNRLAALGMNIVVLVALVGSAWYQWRFVRGSFDYGEIERWHMRYLPVYLAWTAIVALAFPVIFGWM